MQIRYLVLDQNKLRVNTAPEVADMLANSPDTHFVLPDASMIEMTKNRESRERIVRRSLQMLSMHPERVHVAYNIAETLRNELAAGVSMANCLRFNAATAFLRNVLHAIANDNANRSALDRILASRKHYVSLDRTYYRHSFNKLRIAELLDTLKTLLSESHLNDLRKDRLSQADRHHIISVVTPSLTRDTLHSEYRWEDAKIWPFLEEKPVLLRLFYLRMWVCLEWARNGGFESRREADVSNDLLDHEYVLTGTSFDGLLSNDSRVNKAYEELRSLISMPIVRSPTRLV